ncbi:MAG: methyltransferase domain-containing protein [Nocardioides sp.]|nr:methyltransferase domain-containing protein [Nocardioides sp.]
MPGISDRDDEGPDALLGEWYANHYSRVAATADGSFFHRYMHTAMERRFPPTSHFPRVLEVGGNRGEHLPFVRHGFDEYLLTDLRAPQVTPEVMADPRIKTDVCDVANLPYAEDSFDRVIATCLMHHVDSPYRAAQEMRRVARHDGGRVTLLVPADPGFAYGLGKRLTSGRTARKAGVADRYRLISALDHRNHFGSIREQLKHVFRDDAVSVDWRPWKVPSVNLNAFVVVNVRLGTTRSAQPGVLPR